VQISRERLGELHNYLDSGYLSLPKSTLVLVPELMEMVVVSWENRKGSLATGDYKSSGKMGHQN